MNGRITICVMFLFIITAGLYGQANIPQEVDPSSGKMSLTITLTTMTGRGFDLPIVFTYNSDLWNHSFVYGDGYDPSTWPALPTPFGFGWQNNTGGRIYQVRKTINDTTTTNWFFVTNENIVHPFGRYCSYYFDGKNDWTTTDNSWIKVADSANFDSTSGRIDSSLVKPTLSNGLSYDSITSMLGGFGNVSDDGMQGYRFEYMTDANGNRPFHFQYEKPCEHSPVGSVEYLSKIEGLKDTAFFYYDTLMSGFPVLDSFFVRSGTGSGSYKISFRFYKRTVTVYSPSMMEDESATRTLIDSIKMNGEILYKFTYNSNGEMASVTNRTGGKKEFFFSTHRFWEVNEAGYSRTCYTRRVDSVKVTPRSNEAYTWRYAVEIDSLYKNPSKVTVKTPSNNKVEFSINAYLCDDNCGTSLSRDGLIKQMATFKDTLSGALSYISKTENFWVTDQAGASGIRWNAHIDTSVTTWNPTDGSAYNWIDSNIVVSEDVYNNPLVVRQTIRGMGEDFTQTSNYVYEGYSYTSRNLIGFLKEEYSGYMDSINYLSKTIYKYDDAACSTYSGSFAGWITPDSCRGNLTTIISYGASDTAFEQLGPGGDSSIAMFRYDQFGNQIKSITYPSPDNPETTYTRYANTDPNRYVFPVQTVNYVTSTVGSLSTSTVYNFHTGLPDSISDFNGQWTRFTYDDFGRVLTVKLPGETSASSRCHYNDVATVPYEIDSVKLDASRWLISYTYTDGFGSVIQTQSVNSTDSKTLVTDFKSRVDTGYTMASNTREVSGALSSYQTPNWSTLKYTKTYFDALGRDTLSVDPLGYKTWRKYGIDGAPWSLVKVQNDSTNYWQSWTKTIKNSRGLTEKIINGGKYNSTEKADTTLFEYYYPNYPVSLVKQVTNPKGQVTYYYYDRAGRLRGIDGPDVAADTFYVDRDNDTNDVDVLLKYDDMNRVIDKTTPRGTIRNSYDEIGRLVQVDTRESDTSYTPSLVMVYDSSTYGRGRLVMSKMPGVRGIAYAYDSLGRTTMKATAVRYSQGWKTVRYGYNDAGLLTKIIYPKPDTANVADTVKYIYDNFGRIDSVPKFLNHVKYGSNGLIDSIYYANGVKTGYTYNDRLETTYLKTHMGATNLISQGYGYEPGGLVHSVTDEVSGYTGYSMTYKYDHLGRLAKFTSSAVTDSFEYDKAGNRTLRRSGDTNYVYNYTTGTNRLASISNEGWSFNYDSSGNIIKQMLASDALFFDYDIYGRLIESKNDEDVTANNPCYGDTIVGYEYGGAGDLRCRKTVIVGTGQLSSTGPFLKLEDELNDLTLSLDLNDAKRDIGDVYIRNSTDTFYIAIFPSSVDPTFSNSSFAIAIDNDRQYNSGKARLPMDTMTILSSYSYWEYCLYLNGPTSYGYYDTSGTQHALAGGVSYGFSRGDLLIRNSQNYDTCYLITVLKDSIPLDSILGISVISFKPGYSNTDESKNGGSSGTDIVPGGSDDLATGVWEKVGRGYDPESGDTSAGHGCKIKIQDRIYIYDGLTPLVEYSTVYAGEYSNALVRYVYGIPGATIRIETKPDGTGRDTVFLHTDGLGSVRSITNPSGTELSHYRYDAFGKLIESASDTTGNTRRFCGKDWDVEESFLYMTARYYDPRFGRFTSPDPEQTTMSPYSYCLNNPVSLVDPTGHRSGCAGGGYSLNYPKVDYMFLLYVKNTPEAQIPPWKTELDVNDPISYLYAHFTGMEDIFRKRDLHFILMIEAQRGRLEADAERRIRLREEQLHQVGRWLYLNNSEYADRVDEQASGKAGYKISRSIKPRTTVNSFNIEKGLGIEGKNADKKNPEIVFVEYWEHESELSLSPHLAEGILHEYFEVYAIHLYDIKIGMFDFGNPLHHLVDDYIETYFRNQSYFAESNFGDYTTNMGWWWNSHQGIPSFESYLRAHWH